MNTNKKINADTIKTLLQRLKKRTPNWYNFRYKEISNDKDKNVYIAVLNKFGDVVAVLVYRLDLKYLTECTPVYEKRLNSNFLKMCEEALLEDMAEEE